MKKLILLAALLTSTAAFADNNSNNGQGNIINDGFGNGNSGGNIGSATITNTNTATGGAGGSATSHNTNVNTAIGGKAEQEQYQHQSSYNDNSNRGNKQSVSFTDRKQAPAVFAPGLTNGFECNGSTTLGGSVAGFGIGGGSTHANEDCVNVYLANVLFQLKDEDGGWEILCESDKIAKHSKKCQSGDDVVISRSSERAYKPAPDYSFGHSGLHN